MSAVIQARSCERQREEKAWRRRLQSVSLKPGPEDGRVEAPRRVKAPEVSELSEAATVARELSRFNVWRRD